MSVRRAEVALYACRAARRRGDGATANSSRRFPLAASTAAPIQSPQWATFAVEAEVPDAADSVIIALAMTGNGAAWFGDLALAAIERSG